jgi:hypothetical protein
MLRAATCCRSRLPSGASFSLGDRAAPVSRATGLLRNGPPGVLPIPSKGPARQAGPSALAMFVPLAVLAVFLSGRPLWHTDLWGHLAYGRLIVETRAIPRTEALLSLSAGTPFVDLAWLSQVLGYWAYRWQGIAALQFLYAVVATSCVGLVVDAVNRRTGAVWPALLAAIAFLWAEWPSLKIVRPQLAGLMCFVMLFGLLASRGRRRFLSCLLIPVLFAAWVNLHGSFVVGLGLLGAFAVGRAADLLRRTKELSALWFDRRMRDTVGLFALATLGALANPYGWNIFHAVWLASSNANLAELLDWRPLDIHMKQAQAALAIALVLAIVYWITPRRISAVEPLLLIGLGASALWMSRMIVWWAPIAAYYAGIHAAAIRRRRWVRQGDFACRAHSVSITARAAACAGILAAAFCFSPLGAQTLYGQRLDLRESLSTDTPIGAAAYVRRHPPSGLVFNSLECGDYLLWAGPRALEIFVDSHVHLVPADVWRDYGQVIDMRNGWESILDRRRVNTVVLDALRHPDLVEVLRRSPTWSTAFEDDRSVVFMRQAARTLKDQSNR